VSEHSTVGPWAKEKLTCLGKYLHAYSTILHKQQSLRYVYVDAFSGPGTHRLRQGSATERSLSSVAQFPFEDPEHAEYIRGSPRIALELEYPFTQYVFVENDPIRIAVLEKLKTEYANLQIAVREKDCNEYLRDTLVPRSWGRWRGLVFLDPFGMQVPWSTIELLSRTKAIEVFINFPVGMAIQRLLRRDGKFTTQQRKRMDLYLGSPDWFDVVYQKSTGLFGETIGKAADSNVALTRWYRKRLKELFGFASSARLVRSSSNRPLYYLIHAGPNATGARIADHILRQGEVI
jgi:three-Cys-motif partner protein